MFKNHLLVLLSSIAVASQAAGQNLGYRPPAAGQRANQTTQNPDGTFRQTTRLEQMQDRISQISKAAGGNKGSGGGGGGSGSGGSSSGGSSNNQNALKPLDPSSFQIKMDFSQGQKALDDLIKNSGTSKEDNDKLFKELTQTAAVKPAETSPGVTQAEALAQSLLQAALKAVQQISIPQPQNQLLVNARSRRRVIVGRPIAAGIASGSFDYPARALAPEVESIVRPASVGVLRGLATDSTPTNALKTHGR